MWNQLRKTADQEPFEDYIEKHLVSKEYRKKHQQESKPDTYIEMHKSTGFNYDEGEFLERVILKNNIPMDVYLIDKGKSKNIVWPKTEEERLEELPEKLESQYFDQKAIVGFVNGKQVGNIILIEPQGWSTNVTQEAGGIGVGTALTRIMLKYFPNQKTHGFTEGGKAIMRKLYEEQV